MELFSFIEEFKKNKYTKIYDIGAAEGYYAVGFSLIFPETKIIAYETVREVFEYLKKMVSFNNKDNQIIFRVCNFEYHNVFYCKIIRNSI